ncbi:hypothetical protein EZ428_05305 [Pedobacter frigiditerrae]|uniref:Uncharacterized protein n=1 Tax=Pedobacter frigiditerrae TaxID=2530452 RepID=A0A4R0N4A9_9SPHI|nr:hypothetical protein [Pedobacter frigiditerrae]TCC94197.1 hypothetical protein EZ428_05305 [Pedobacter frigiditerrae]
MKTLKITSPSGTLNKHILPFVAILLAAAVSWQGLPFLLTSLNTEVGLLDNGIWQLLLFALISFLLLLGISILLFRWLLSWLGLPTINMMVLQFKNLQLWQRFVLYWALFALLFLGGLLSLAAIF